MPDPVDTLTVLVEASVAIAGFSGVVVVFGRRAAGKWSLLESSRLVALLGTSFTVLFLSLGALVLLHAGTDQTSTWRIGSTIWAVVAAHQIASGIRRFGLIPKDDSERPSVATPVFWLGATGIVLALNLANAFKLGEFWPFLASLVWLFGLACSSLLACYWFLAVADRPPNKALQTEELAATGFGSLLAFNQVLQRTGQRCPVPLSADPLSDSASTRRRRPSDQRTAYLLSFLRRA